MADSYRSEYAGFTVNEVTREYRLRVTTPGTGVRTFTVAIPNKAFLARRLRYQDAPDICFLKLQRALAEDAGRPGARWKVTESELEEYRDRHASGGKSRSRWPSPRRSSE